MSHPLFGDQAAAALAAAAAEADPDSPAAAQRLRKVFPPELAVAALGQVSLRRKARTKFGAEADSLWFTAAGLEQASRPAVARWRAERFAAAGVRRVIDLGCGIGADARAFLSAGLAVTAVEIDPVTAELARANLPGAEVLVGDVVDLAPTLLNQAGPDTAIFIDPARRTGRGRSWRVADFSPPWSFVLELLAAGHPICVKLGPGLPRELIPAGVEACWVSERGDVVEAGLWRLRPDQADRSSAVLLPGRDQLDADPTAAELAVRPPGRYLFEPDGAVIRARAINQIGTQTGAGETTPLWLLDAQVAYLSSDQPIDSPFATCFEIIEVLDAGEKSLRAWVRDNQIGTLEIKKRAIDVDPAALRRRLKPKGPNAATIVLARTVDGVRALVVRRLVPPG